MHTYRVLYPYLTVNSIASWNDVEQLSVIGNLDTPGAAHNPFQVISAYETVVPRDGYDAAIVDGTNVSPGYADIG